MRPAACASCEKHACGVTKPSRTDVRRRRLGAVPGARNASFDWIEPARQLRVVVDHIPAQQSLSTTFDANLTPAAVTVQVNVQPLAWNIGTTGRMTSDSLTPSESAIIAPMV
mgnify:CR=1 FL=1